MKIYIAGKITGDPQYREKFSWAQKRLEDQGHTVLNPATLQDGLKPADYMKMCLVMIDRADQVCFLPDYTESRGAVIEQAYCEYTGKLMTYSF